MQRLGYEFYVRSTPQVARELIGKILLYHGPKGDVGGRIVETEAYLGKDDPACHSARGMTKKNAAMFGTAGRNYLYHSYGIHICYNITTDIIQLPAAVLVRAVEPLFGVDIMKKSRPHASMERLCAGPGNLTRGMGLDICLNDTDTVLGPLGVYDDGFIPQDITVTGRIGISQAKELPLRYYLTGSPYISRK